MHDFTVVLGVDIRYIEQLKMTFATWLKHKPGIMKRPWVVFYNRETTMPHGIRHIIGPHVAELRTVPWPPEGIVYEGNPDIKWYHPERKKMLAGFVYLPSVHVQTPFWMKLDVDIVANARDVDQIPSGISDDWIDPAWLDYETSAVITAPPWGYTKPPDQMMIMDQWVAKNAGRLPDLANKPPLDLIPEPDATVLPHSKPRRICSWCAFFQTEFTRYCSDAAHTSGRYQTPIPSQDGYTWYIARRLGLKIQHIHMKKRGWRICSSLRNISKAVEESMA